MNEQEKIAEKKPSVFSKPWVQSIVGIAAVFGVLGGFLYWQSKHNTVAVDDSQLSAPIIALSPISSGTLNALYVHEGDVIPANTPVALVGTNVVTSKLAGVIVSVQNNIGATFAPGQAVVSMINPDDLRVVGSVDETKGLKDIAPGQHVVFTVDAFGNKKYTGVVDSVSPTAHDTGVAFSISDKRPIQKFDVKVRFAVADYPELKNGMSAKMTISTK